MVYDLLLYVYHDVASVLMSNDSRPINTANFRLRYALATTRHLGQHPRFA